MMKTDYEWDLILRAAEKLGVSRHARTKWKNRQMVPHRWRLDIIQMTKGAVNWDYFRQMDEQARNAA
jgi:hypothetical protein